MTATNEKSEYIESLSKEGKKVYLAKLTLSNGKQLPDPFFFFIRIGPRYNLHGYLLLSNRIPKSFQQRSSIVLEVIRTILEKPTNKTKISAQ